MIGTRETTRRRQVPPTRLRPDELGKRFIEFWQRQTALDRVSESVDGALRPLLQKPRGKAVADFLNGVWLGHPLHPVLTDLPVGCWSLSALLDVFSVGRRKPGAASTAALTVGVVSAVPTAAAGVMDWHKHLSGPPKRVGLAHAFLNSAALLCYMLSLFFRLTGRGPARRWSFLGFGLATLSAYLGGHLVFADRAGVRHDPETPPPEQAGLLIGTGRLSDGELHRVDLDGFPVVIGRRGDLIFALGDTCPHLGCSLADGRLEGDLLRCTCHGSAFSIEDGRVIEGPATSSVPVFEVTVQGARFDLARRDEAL